MVSTKKKTRGNLRDGLRKKTKDQRDGFSKQSWNLRDGFGAVPGNRGDGFIKIRRDRDDELCQNSRRRTCKRQEKVYETTSASQRNKFDVLRSIESGSEDEEVNAVDVVQEIVEITVDSGAAKGVWPIRTRFEVGRDRKTAYERSRHVVCRADLVEEEEEASGGTAREVAVHVG